MSASISDLKEYLAQNPGAVIEDVARERNISPRTVIEALPSDMVRICGEDAFAEAMQDIAQWGRSHADRPYRRCDLRIHRHDSRR